MARHRASSNPPSSSSLPSEDGRASVRPLSPAALYDAIYESRGADVAVYLGLALPCPGPALELGAGSGRLLSPLLTKGIDAYGLESDPEMLLAGHRRLLSVGGDRWRRRLLEGDMRDFSLPQKFSLILLACNTASLLLEDEELLSALRCAQRHLSAEGSIALDISLVEGHTWFHPPYDWQGQTQAVWVDGVAATTTEYGDFDPETRLCRVRREFVLVDGRRAETLTVTRQRSMPQLRTLLEQAGLGLVGEPVDEAGRALGPTSTLAFLRARPAASGASAAAGSAQPPDQRPIGEPPVVDEPPIAARAVAASQATPSRKGAAPA